MLEDAGVGVLVSESAVVQRLAESVAGVDVVRMDEEEERKKIGEESGEDFARGVGCENLAQLLLGSGSTGKAEGGARGDRGLPQQLGLRQEQAALGEDDVVWQKTPSSF